MLYEVITTNQLGVLHGFGFSAGLFDMIINWGLATKPLTLILIGVGFGLLYFVTFYAGIRLLDLKTPGREVEVSVITSYSIHYTKLYDGAARQFGDGDRQLSEPSQLHPGRG